MKLRITLASLIICLAVGAVKAQPKFKLYPDSVRVEMPDQNGLVVFEFMEFLKSESVVRDFSSTLTEVLDIVRKGYPGDLQESGPQSIVIQEGPEGTREVGLGVKPYGEKRHMTIRPMEPQQTSVTIIKGKGIVELLPPGWEILIVSKEYRIKVYAVDFPSLESIARQDFGIVADAVKNDEGMKALGRKCVETQMVIRNNALEQRTANYVHPGDMIHLGLQGGVGLVQNILYPELSIKLGLTFRDRTRRPNFRPSLVATQLYFTEQTSEGFDIKANTFLSGTVEVNFDKKSGKASWSGLGIGFLINRNGNYFQGNTGKFFITHTIPGSRFSMAPEFYLTDDFKKFNFGMVLKYSF